MGMDISVLEKAGLTRGESLVYLALLEIGESTSGPVIEQSGVSGSKVYEILDRLAKKGLVSFVIKEKTKYFQASPPRRILDFLEEREKEISLNKRGIEKILPELEARRKVKEKTQSAQVFEGIEGIKTAFNLILENMEAGEEYHGFSLGEELIRKLEPFLIQYHI